MTEVRFRLLGAMEISVHGEPMPLPGSAERALLAQLLLTPGRTIPATMLIDRLWSESSLPVDPMNALQIRVSKLRRALKSADVPELVTREGVGYRAHVAAEQVDAVDFEQRIRAARVAVAHTDGHQPEHLAKYDDALSLWRGDPLSDFSTETWATVEASRLQELRLVAMTERAQIALGLGRHLEVVGDLEPVVAGDPRLESLAGLLMVALYRSGRQADALDVFARTRDVLDEDLGLEPSLSLRSLHERVLRQDESLGVQPDMAPGAVSVPHPRRRDAEVHVAPTNLPTVERVLIGREEQLEALVSLVEGTKLLTLVGPGGAGKTSLALSTVVRTSGSFPDGVFGIRLAAVDAPDRVPLAVADALGVPLDGAAADRDVRDRLISYLGRKRMLLLFDNCEHIVDAVAGLVEDILGRCPGVTVLATSREALAVPDEVQLPIGPLAVPPDGTPAASVMAYAACQLFAERSRAVKPGLPFGDDELVAISHVARALDGIPLALELAAARTASMSTGEIASRLGERFALLTSGARTAEARQKTLRATVDWSYALLTEREQRVFNRLAVFRGGWTLAAAEAVVGDENAAPGEVLDTIGRLVERSMVVTESGATTRYRTLETLRQYADEQLAAAGETDLLSRRHAEYFSRFVQKAETDMRRFGQREALRRLREDQPNVRTALAWFEGRGDDLDSALIMAGSLGLFWHLGRHLEGREVLANLLSAPGGSTAARARAMQAVSIVERPRACLVHPSPRCAETAEESLSIFEELGDSSRAALSRVLLAVEGVTGVERERSEALLREAEEQFVRDGDAWGRAVIGFVRMETALKNGEEESAIRIGRATSTAFRQLDDPWGLSAILYHLGWGLRQFGRYDEAARALEEAIDVADSAGLYNTVQWALADLALEKIYTGHFEEASALLDRAAAASEHVGDGAGEALAGFGHGLLARIRGDWQEARQYFADAVDAFAALGTPVPEGLALAAVARCDEEDRREEEAMQHYHAAIAIGRRAGEPGLTATGLEGLGRVALAQGHGSQADELIAEAAELRVRFGRPAPPHERADLETALAGARTG
jgi:predicted ATPase/DNA-binding SARP family transcriptional activator